MDNMVDTTKLEYFISKGLKRLLFVSCRFPAFNDEYIKQNIDKPTTSKEDLECYLSSSTSIGRKRALFLVTVYITYCFKNAYIPYQSFSTVNYDDLESNIRVHSDFDGQSLNSQNATSFKSFACLWTNCSRLSPQKSCDASMITGSPTNYHHSRLSGLAHDVIMLPLFALCSPIAEVLYTPAIKLDSFGVLISAAACLNVFLLGSYTTIQQFISPAPNDMIMFVCAPKATTQVVRSRAGQLFFDLIASFHNFRSKPVWKRRIALSSRRTQAQCGSQLARGARLTSAPSLNHPLSDLTLDWSEFNDMNSDGNNLRHRGRQDSKHSIRTRTLIGQADAMRQSEQLQGSELSRLREETRDTMKRHNLGFESRTPEEIDKITDSCLPIIKTDWYRPYSARVLNHTLLLAMSLIGLVGLFAFGFIGYRTHIKSHELRLVAREIERQNCVLWRAPASEIIDNTTLAMHSLEMGEVVELDQIDFGWTWFAMLLGFVNLIPGFTVAVLFAYYWACLCELSIWLAELRMFLVASLAVAKYKMSPTIRNSYELSYHASKFENCTNYDQVTPGLLPWSPDAMRRSLAGSGQPDIITHRDSRDDEDNAVRWWSPLSTTNLIKTHHFYSMELLRDRFQRECWFIEVNFLSCLEKDNQTHVTGSINSKRVDQNHFKQFVDELFFHHMPANDLNQGDKTPERADSICSQLTLCPRMQQRDNLTSELECMEQIYINFRLFVEQVLSLTPSVKVVLAITYLLNYGLVFIAIMCSRKMSTLKAEPMCIITFGWFISNYLILLAANFHAEAKKLQPLLWSLIAQLTHSDNLRAQHMRYLWTKQALTLDDSGGLALSAFGLRVTYVNIIQLALGTATIIVISIRPG